MLALAIGALLQTGFIGGPVASVSMARHQTPSPLTPLPPEIFEEVLPHYMRLREDAWARLLAHELSHSWIRVGPRWFREGLAIIAADQGIGDDIRLASPDPALASIDWQNDPHAYARSAAHVRFYMERIPLRELLAKASSPEFEAWLRDRWQRKQPASWPA